VYCRLVEDTARTLQAIEQAVAGLSPQDFTRAPAGKWSAEQILEHLDLTFAGTVKTMRRALEKGPRVLPSRVSQRFLKWLVVGFGYVPHGRKAPEPVQPRGGQGAAVVDAIRQHLRETDEAIAAFEQKYGPRATHNHPVLGALTAQQWRRFHLVHTRHHMKQVRARSR
jgi:hypothetical protein